MKIFHTADWHLGKLVQGFYMTDDQQYILQQFIEEIRIENPDVIIIAGDLYDRQIPPPEAVKLLNETINTIVIELNIPVLAIAGNHDSPSRLQFGSEMMRERGFYIRGELTDDFTPVILHDEYGPVHFHLVPYADPSIVKHLLNDETIANHDDAAQAIIHKITEKLDKSLRHVFVGHAFVTPSGETKENTSESERPLSIGGAEYVNASHFTPFDYVALGHLHQAHYVKHEHIRYAGSPLKYSLSEQHHQKGYSIINLAEKGSISIEKRLLTPRRDLRLVEERLENILKLERNDDYVFVRLLDEAPVLTPMEKIRSVFPNVMHIERKSFRFLHDDENAVSRRSAASSDRELFKAFYREVTQSELDQESEQLFVEMLDELVKMDNE